MSKKKFIQNSIIYTIGDLLPKVISFFMLRLYTSYLSRTDYGIVNMLTTTMGFLSMIYLLGLEGALTRFYYSCRDEEERKTLISTFWIFLFGYNIILTVLFFFFGQPIGHLISSSIPFDPFFRLMVINCFLTTFTVMPLMLFRIKEEAAKFGLFNILTTVVTTSFMVYFVAYRRMGAVGNISGYICANAIFVVIYFVLNIKDLRFSFSLDYLKQGLKYGIPLIPHAVGGWVLMASDRFFMEKYRGLDELGLYSAGYQLGMLVYYLITAINKAYVPFFFKTAEEENDKAKRIFREVVRYYIVFMITIGVGISLFSREIAVVMMHPDYYEAYKVIPIVALAYVVDGFYFATVNGIFYVKKTHLLAFTTGITAVVDIIANFLLIPRMGMYGAALATLIAYTVLFLSAYYFSQKYYYIEWDWKKIIVNLGIGFVVFGLSMYQIENFFLSFGYKTLLFVLYAALLFAFRILSWDTVKGYVRKVIKR